MENFFQDMPFWKLSVCGNSAILMPGVGAEPDIEAVCKLLSPEQGIGADNLLLYSTSGCPTGLDMVVDGYNTDGSRVGLCANGARGLTWLGVHLGRLDKNQLSFEILMDETRITTKIENFESGRISLMTAPPSFDPDTIPFTGSASHGELEILGDSYEYVVVNVGNPHCVLFVDRAPTEEWIIRVGLELENNRKLFPDRVNISLCFLKSTNTMIARIFERGVGATTSSGTGSIAIATAARSFMGADSMIEVHMPGGVQTISWAGGGAPVEGISEVKLESEGIIGQEPERKRA